MSNMITFVEHLPQEYLPSSSIDDKRLGIRAEIEDSPLTSLPSSLLWQHHKHLLQKKEPNIDLY